MNVLLKRKENLETHLSKDHDLLKAYEDKLRFEDDPKKKASFKTEIAEIKERIQANEIELDETAYRLRRSQTAPPENEERFVSTGVSMIAYETELKYANYSLVMNRERQTAFFVAGNIDGSLLWRVQGQGKLPPRPAWSFDPRMEDSFQADDEIFSNSMQRGHLFKREDSVWGADRDAMRLADEHSFTITNATPMIGNFNNVEWGDLEDIVSREAQLGKRISYFAGPVFRSTDRFFNELKANVPAAERFQGMRVPEAFWKIVVWVEDSTLKAAGFMLKQTDEIQSHGPITEEINFGTYKKIPIREIEQATGLSCSNQDFI